jgi:threonine/homoserine/homoserine lactone efflux protein
MIGGLLAATGVLALLTVVPGPDMAVVTRTALTAGRPAATRAAAGIVTGLAVWGVLTVAGLAAVLAASAGAYTVVRLVGAAYLVVLGIQTLRRRGHRHDGTATTAAVASGSPFRTGLVSNLLNPKIAVFYTAALPQLVPDGAPEAPTLAALVAIHVVLSLAWLHVYAGLVALLDRGRVRRWLDTVTGTVLVGLGLRLALDDR